MNLERLASCAELTTEHATEAAGSSASMRVLLAWASRVARPGNGTPKVLMAIARLPNAEWVEGTPYVEITGDASTTTISIFCDHGMGIRERLLPICRFNVSVDEFTRAVRLAPRLITPFRAVQRGATLLLTPRDVTEDAREVISIDESSLHEQERKTAPPPMVKESGAPPVSAKVGPTSPDQSGVHTHPTVRRMVAVRPEALRRGGKDD